MRSMVRSCQSGVRIDLAAAWRCKVEGSRDRERLRDPLLGGAITNHYVYLVVPPAEAHLSGCAATGIALEDRLADGGEVMKCRPARMTWATPGAAGQPADNNDHGSLGGHAVLPADLTLGRLGMHPGGAHH